ncbi:colicin immunity domain-containing protein [Amycolatopsis mongoliensis]|uniref:Colicin immunity domain-containing protein n=1 Tax=Amycolatopsis mongoliensis TaxID=715475 RepID=A0A9Y2JTC7_9PSEU|nr:colicin immunity domain-containing protein [Amycolatopsis sp. 4-36]WIY03848.1 colicin immunity domain-containing protein [Amycolatopsis sp. 4-36]
MAEHVDPAKVRTDLRQYVELIDLFVSGAIGAPEFETRYLALAKADEAIRDQAAYDVLQWLFGDVDEYFDDPDESPEERAKAAELLRGQARDALAKLIRF